MRELHPVFSEEPLQPKLEMAILVDQLAKSACNFTALPSELDLATLCRVKHTMRSYACSVFV